MDNALKLYSLNIFYIVVFETCFQSENSAFEFATNERKASLKDHFAGGTDFLGNFSNKMERYLPFLKVFC